MRTIQFITLSLLTAGCFSARAQVQNTNFEDWTVTDTTWDGQPIYVADQWSGGKRTEESFSGAYAAKVEPYLSCGIARNYMVYGSSQGFSLWGEPDFTGSGAPVNFKLTQLTGYFKFVSPQPEDEATGLVVLRKFNPITGISEEVGRGEVVFSPSETYAPFTIQVTDLQPGVMPDSMIIAFSSGMGFGFENDDYHYGTLFVDQLRMQQGSVAGLPEEALSVTGLYPNPSSGAFHFAFETKVQDKFTLVLTDAAGRVVKSQAVIPGVESIVETRDLPAGIYVATVCGATELYGTRRVVVGVD